MAYSIQLMSMTSFLGPLVPDRSTYQRHPEAMHILAALSEIGLHFPIQAVFFCYMRVDVLTLHIAFQHQHFYGD